MRPEARSIANITSTFLKILGALSLCGRRDINKIFGAITQGTCASAPPSSYDLVLQRETPSKKTHKMSSTFEISRVIRSRTFKISNLKGKEHTNT
jgi:hypothetical protein